MRPAKTLRALMMASPLKGERGLIDLVVANMLDSTMVLRTNRGDYTFPRSDLSHLTSSHRRIGLNPNRSFDSPAVSVTCCPRTIANQLMDATALRKVLGVVTGSLISS